MISKIILFLLAPFLVFANFSQRLENLNEEAFWRLLEEQGTPIITEIPGDENHAEVTFVWHGDANTQNVVLFGTLWMDPEKNQLQRVPNTNIWYKTEILERDLRGVYFLSPNASFKKPYELDRSESFNLMKSWQSDPLNPKKYTLSSLRLTFSELELPNAAPQPWVTPQADISAGKIVMHQFSSSCLDNHRTLWIYLPPEYSYALIYSLLILFDGEAYTQIVPTPTILDNMIAAKVIPPLVAVFIDNPSSEKRSIELPCNSHFAQFLAEELLPWLHDRYSITNDPNETIIAGSSYGGLAAAFAAFSYPNIFGKVLCQSAAFWWKPENWAEFEWLTKQYAESPKANLQFYLDVGKHETIDWWGHPSVLQSNRNFRDTLLEKGYKMTYCEFNGGHEYIWWRGTLADGIRALIPDSDITESDM